jgi:hypothetical protein
MKKQFLILSALLVSSFLFINCSKSNDSTPAPSYTPGQGKITATGDATFSVTGSASYFYKKADTIYFKATVGSSDKQFLVGMVAKGTGTVNFNNSVGNLQTTYTSGAVAIYIYTTINSAGTIIAHEFEPGTGAVNITYLSATGVEGTYSGTLKDNNNNGDAPINISGTFSGNF